MEFTDYYATLGVARDATPAQVKAAYRKLARTLHPDVNSDTGAEARFKRVNEAYEVLKDPGKRAKYDRLGADWEAVERREEAMRQHRAKAPSGAGSAGGASGFSDFFETFFGRGGVDVEELLRSGGGSFTYSTGGRAAAAPAPRRGHDIQEEVPVTLTEAMQGGRRLLTIGSRTVEVRVPAGVTDGSVVRVAGEGGEGAGSGTRGDVLLRVRLRADERFAVRDRDLLADLPVRDDQAALGSTVDVPGPSGPLQVTVPPGTPGGRVLRLRGRGIPGLRGPAGDLLLTVRVTQPAPLSDAELDVYRRLAELRDQA